MSVTTATLLGKVEALCRTDTPAFVSGAVDTYIAGALAVFSKDKPYHDVEDVTGSAANLQATPSSWVERASLISKIVHPYVDEDSDEIDPDAYQIDTVPSGGVPVEKIRMADTPAATETVRVWYSRPYAAVTEVSAGDETALACMVASMIERAKASYFLGLKDQGLTADLVDYGQKAIEARALSKMHHDAYRQLLGLSDDGPVPAAVAGDIDTDPQYFPSLSHQRHHRDR